MMSLPRRYSPWVERYMPETPGLRRTSRSNLRIKGKNPLRTFHRLIGIASNKIRALQRFLIPGDNACSVPLKKSSLYWLLLSRFISPTGVSCASSRHIAKRTGQARLEPHLEADRRPDRQGRIVPACLSSAAWTEHFAWADRLGVSHLSAHQSGGSDLCLYRLQAA